MKMLRITSAAALIAAALLFSPVGIRPAPAASLPHHRIQKDLPPGLQRSLTDKISDEAGPYLDEQDQRKNAKKTYVDLQQKFEYLPTWGPHHQLTCSVKLGGAQYDPNKPGSSKGAATGTLKYLVFSYALKNGKWVEMAKPRWEQQVLGAAAGGKMTGNIARGDKYKQAQQKAAAAHAAAAAAAAAAQKAANH
ncbi:MAG TPA: hypothetical protein VMV27_16020 [Candidatus Binataceae bacterium]|nr:hypothetical protein [Candidatus Binataceae bacterium]